MPQILTLNSLTKKYGKKTVVNNLSFEVEKGDLFGFLGPNGAGKTTTLSMLLGLVKPTSGTFNIFGYSNDNLYKIKNNIGALIESPAFYDYLTAEQNLNLFTKFYSNIPKNHVDELLELVDLQKVQGTKVGTFSQGMKQRLWIAQALIGYPELLILDEPTNGLDPEGTYDIWRVFKQLVKEKNITILISSHLLHEIEENCNKVCIIADGKKIECGFVLELLHNLASMIEIEIENCDEEKLNKIFSSHKEIVIKEKRNDNGLTIIRINLLGTISPSKINQELNFSGFSVKSFRTVKKTLKEYFLDIVANIKEGKT